MHLYRCMYQIELTLTVSQDLSPAGTPEPLSYQERGKEPTGPGEVSKEARTISSPLINHHSTFMSHFFSPLHYPCLTPAGNTRDPSPVRRGGKNQTGWGEVSNRQEQSLHHPSITTQHSLVISSHTCSIQYLSPARNSRDPSPVRRGGKNQPGWGEVSKEATPEPEF